MTIRRRRFGIVAAVLTLFIGLGGVVTAPSAAAYEGECQQSNVNNLTWDSILPCRYGYNHWYDSATINDNSGTVLHLVNCTSNPDITLMFSVDGETLWTTKGTKRFYCLNTDGGWKDWGDMQRGYYKFVVSDPRSGNNNRFNIGYFHSAW